MKYKRVFYNIHILILTFMILSSSLFAGDWPNWRGSDFNGVSKEINLDLEFGQEGPKLLWEFDPGKGFSSISVASGKAYLMGNKGDVDTVYCLDAVSGKLVWKHSYAEKLDPKYYQGGTSSTPTVADGKVYTISKDGKTFCLDAMTGKVVWQTDVAQEYGFKRPTWGFAGSVLVVDDLLILNAGKAGLALNKTTGKLVWGANKEPGGYATAVPFENSGKKVIAMFGSDNLMGLEPSTGKMLWEYKWNTKHGVNAADPIIIGDRIFISSGYGTGCAMIKVEGVNVSELWRNRNIKTKMSGAVLINGLLFGPDESEGLKCIDPDTGAEYWAEKKFKQGALCAADGKLIVLSEKGELAVVEASKDGYHELSSAKVLGSQCWAMPVVANGRLYVRDSKRAAKCFDLTK